MTSVDGNSGTAILSGGMIQPNSEASELEILCGKNIYYERPSTDIFQLTFNRALDKFKWEKMESKISRGVGFHSAETIDYNGTQGLIFLGGLMEVQDKIKRRGINQVTVFFPSSDQVRECKLEEDCVQQNATCFLSASSMTSLGNCLYFYGGYTTEEVHSERRNNKPSGEFGEISVTLDGSLKLKRKFLNVECAFPFLFATSTETMYISCGTNPIEGLLTNLHPREEPCHLLDNCKVAKNIAKFLSTAHLFIYCEGKCKRLMHSDCAGLTKEQFEKLQDSDTRYYCKRTDCNK